MAVNSSIGSAAIDIALRHRGKRLISLIAIALNDNVTVLRFTDSDRQITIGNSTYTPIALSGSDDIVRRAGLKASDHPVSGLIEGTNIRIADLNGGKYRGALVSHVIVDGIAPHIYIGNKISRLTHIKYTRVGWSAQLSGLTASMDSQRSSRFRGTHSPVCPYLLGGQFCKKDISPWINPGIQVTTVSSPYSKFETSAARWRASYADQFFRHGEITWMWSSPQVTGTATSIVNINTLTDTTKSWTVNEHVGKHVRILTGAGAGLALGALVRGEYGVITSNTSNTLFYSSLTQTYAIGTNYDICGLSQNHAVTVPLSLYTNSNRELELFLPTPLPISVGDSGIVRPGCDGLFSTCQSKFANQLNFGGTDVDAPPPAEIIKAPEDS